MDFEDRINDYLDEKSKELKMPKQQMCQYAVEKFSGPGLPPSKIRLQVDQKFKEKHRVKNVQKRKKKQKLSKSDISILGKVKKALVDHANGIGNPIYEQLVWLNNAK